MPRRSNCSASRLASRKDHAESQTHILQIDELLELTVDKGATDLHLKVPSPPVLRIDGVLTPQEDWPALTPQGYRMHI